MDPKDIDQDNSGGKAKGGRWQERKGEASGKGDVMAKGKEESALELEGYISQQARIRLFSPDSKVLSSPPNPVPDWISDSFQTIWSPVLQQR